jgi:hypothetical protein
MTKRLTREEGVVFFDRECSTQQLAYIDRPYIGSLVAGDVLMFNDLDPQSSYVLLRTLHPAAIGLERSKSEPEVYISIGKKALNSIRVFGVNTRIDVIDPTLLLPQPDEALALYTETQQSQSY